MALVSMALGHTDDGCLFLGEKNLHCCGEPEQYLHTYTLKNRVVQITSKIAMTHVV